MLKRAGSGSDFSQQLRKMDVPQSEEAALIARIRELSSDSLESAIERGHLLKELNLKWHEYEAKRVGVSHQTAYKLMALVDHERMRRDDWAKPRQWTACYELLCANENIFEAMLKRGLIGYNTTARQIREFAKAFRRKFAPVVPSTELICPVKRGAKTGDNSKCLNRIVQGDCLLLIPQLEDESITAMITSPPYASQRDKFYQGVPEEDYPAWWCSIMDAVRPKLRNDGSVFVVIRSHVEHGALSDYVLKTVLAVRQSGWIQPEELIWYKNNAPPNGSIYRPRRSFEHILWFSKTRNPYVDLTAAGHPSHNIGYVGESKKTDRLGLDRRLGFSSDKLKDGKAKIKDVLQVGTNCNDKGIDHPAIYPRPLVNTLLLTFTRPGDVILEPFAGSGTTALCAAAFDRNFIAFDLEQKYVDLANKRLKSDAQTDNKLRRALAAKAIIAEERIDEETVPHKDTGLRFLSVGTWTPPIIAPRN
jgi:DNA modification methylase